MRHIVSLRLVYCVKIVRELQLLNIGSFGMILWIQQKYNEPVTTATLAVFATLVAMSLGLAVGDTVEGCEVACCVYRVGCCSHCCCDCHRHLNYGRTAVQSSWQFDDLDDCCVER